MIKTCHLEHEQLWDKNLCKVRLDPDLIERNRFFDRMGWNRSCAGWNLSSTIERDRFSTRERYSLSSDGSGNLWFYLRCERSGWYASGHRLLHCPTKRSLTVSRHSQSPLGRISTEVADWHGSFSAVPYRVLCHRHWVRVKSKCKLFKLKSKSKWLVWLKSKSKWLVWLK